MRAVRRRLRVCAWLALLAILALAVGPTVSRLLLPAGNAFAPGTASQAEPARGEATAPRHDIASTHHHHHHDMAMVPATTPAPTQPSPHEHALEHCGLCLLAAHGFTFVQDRPALVACIESTRPALDLITPALPRLRSDWSPASSRGPPLRG
jgi:hypothetical protein